MKINDSNDEMILWNGLPAMLIEHSDRKKYWAFFSNIDNEVVIGRIPENELDLDIHYIKAKNAGAFKCFDDLKKTKNEIMTLVLCLTEKCNSRCRYCFLEAHEKGTSMSMDLLHHSIDKGIELANGRHLCIAAFGGEPGIEEDLLQEMVRYSKAKLANSNVKSFEFRITTNGLISDKVINLISDNNFIMNLSMDGIPEVQNFQRPLPTKKESYPIVENTINKLLESNKVTLTIRCTVTNFSVTRMPETVKLLASLGIKLIHFEPVTPGGRGATADKSLQPPEAETFVRYLKESIKVGEDLNVDIICFPYMNISSAPRIFCDGKIQNRLVVSPEGNLSSCVEVQSQNHELFDALGLGFYDSESRKIIITSDERRSACRGCEVLKTTERGCSSCPLNFYCGGGCPTRNYRGSASTEIIDNYRCKITREMLPHVLKMFYYETYGN